MHAKTLISMPIMTLYNFLFKLAKIKPSSLESPLSKKENNLIQNSRNSILYMGRKGKTKITDILGYISKAVHYAVHE